MKHAVWIFFGIILGFLLGGIQPRIELQKSNEREKVLIQRLAKKNPNLSSNFLPFLPEQKPNKTTSKKPNKIPTKAQKKAASVAPKSKFRKPTKPKERPEPSAETQQAELETFVDTQRLRAQQSKAALIEQAGFDDEEVEAMEEIIDQLNSDLMLHAEDMIRLMQTQMDNGEVDDQEMLHLTHKISGDLYQAQKEMDALVGDDVNVDKEAKRVFNLVEIDFLLDEENRVSP